MDDRKPKADDDAPKIDPALKDKKSNETGGSVPPVGQSGPSQRDDNVTDATRTTGGARKRAEEGL